MTCFHIDMHVDMSINKHASTHSHSIITYAGNILDMDSGLMLMTFYGALLCGVYKSVYNKSSLSIVHPGTGQSVSINQAIRTSLLGHDTCLVYDTEQSKQVLV